MTGLIQQDIHELTEAIKGIRSEEDAGNTSEGTVERHQRWRRREFAFANLGSQWRAAERVVDRLRELEGE